MKLSDLLLKEKIDIHEELNDKIWENETLKSDIKVALDKIAEAFIDFLKLKVVVKDILITGSNCGYTYHTGSDLDLHIELDTKKFDCIDIMEYLTTKKTLWNSQHNIKIHNIPVELYAETATTKTIKGAGVYSLKKNIWIQKPSKEHPEIDQPSVDRKVLNIKNQIDNIINHKVDDLDVIQKLKDSIKNLRKVGLEKGGEFSINNLAFKQLRDGGYLEKLSNYSDNLKDNILGLI